MLQANLTSIPKEIVIIGGGYSIQEGVSLGLKEKIKDKFTIGINFSFHHFDSTFLCFGDANFYMGYLKGDMYGFSQEHLDTLKKLPLIIGENHNFHEVYSNSILFRTTPHWENVTENVFYKYNLTGTLALYIGTKLIDFEGTIYLLGFDWTESKEQPTHYYPKSEINHRGQGLRTWYRANRPSDLFSSFLTLNKVKIYNVCPTSNIPTFEKIRYSDMFNLLTSDIYDQNNLRNLIKNKLQKS